MSTSRLYYPGDCPSCAEQARALAAQGEPVEVHDVTSDPAARAALFALGYHCLPVRVPPDGTVPDHVHELQAAATPPAAPALHPGLASLAPLLGEWSGQGRGSYPSIDDFDYLETLHFSHLGKPFVTYAQFTRQPADGKPMHVETGYLRLTTPGRVELVIAQPTGVVEVHEGSLDTSGDAALQIRLRSSLVGCTATAKSVTRVERTFRLTDGVLHTELAMAAVGFELTHHLASQLRRPATDQEVRP